MFTLTPGSSFVDNVSTITAGTLNLWRAWFPRALDAVQGGTYTPTATIEFASGTYGWAFKGPVAVNRTTLENTLCTVNALRDFRMVKTVTSAGSVPNGSGGTDVAIWTTPSEPYIIESAIIRITGTATATSDPGQVKFGLAMGGSGGGNFLIKDCITTAWGGTSYGVDPVTNSTNKVAWGLDQGEHGNLLTDGSFAHGALNGALGSYAGFAALTAGDGTNGFWAKTLNLNITHTAGGSVFFSGIPLKIELFGRLLS